VDAMPWTFDRERCPKMAGVLTAERPVPRYALLRLETIGSVRQGGGLRGEQHEAAGGRVANFDTWCRLRSSSGLKTRRRVGQYKSEHTTTDGS